MGCTGFSSPVVYDLNYDGVDEAIRIANDTIYGLAAGLWTKDIDRAFADGEWAGMQPVAAPAEDPLTGLRTATLREPSGNLVELREAASS